MASISMYFDVVSCDIKYLDYILMYKGYYVSTYFISDKIVTDILSDMFGEDHVKKNILKSLINVDLCKLDKSEKSFEHINFLVEFNFDIDEETLFYIKLKYPDSYNIFNRKIKN